MSPARRWRRVAAGVVVVLGLVSCAHLPTDGPVRAGRSEAPAAGPFQYDASRPSPGTQPRELVQGFLQAGAAGMSGDDFEVARTFLTGPSASEWSPLSQVVVAANDAPLTPRIVLPADDDDDDDGGADGTGANGTGANGTGANGAGANGTGANGTGDEGPANGTAEPDAEQVAQAERVLVVVEVVSVGALDETGAYTPAPGRLAGEVTFELVRVEGEWRIETLPPGLLLTEGAFATVFRAVPLAFLSPGRDVLVPDVRYVPTRRAQRYAVDQLLTGPTPWLADAVTTAVPAGLRVDAGRGVVIEEATGNVQVYLTGADVPPAAADLLYAQIVQTLLSIPSVWTVTVWFGGTPYEPPADARLPALVRDVGTRMVALSEGHLVLLTGEEVTLHPGYAELTAAADGAQAGAGTEATEAQETPAGDQAGSEPGDPSAGAGAGDSGGEPDTVDVVEIPPAPPAIDTSDWRAPTLAYGDDPEVALVAGSELLLLTSAGQERVLATGPDLIAPSFDRFDWVWSGVGGELIAVPAEGGEAVSVPGQDGDADGPAEGAAGEVVGVRVSRDGARVLVSRRSGEHVVLSVHGVVRDESNAPVAIGAGVPLAAYESLLGAVWADATTVVTLGTGTVGGPTATALAVRTGPATGPMTPLSVTAQPVSVAAGDGLGEIFVASSEGRLMARGATRGWSAVADHITDPSFPG